MKFKKILIPVVIIAFVVTTVIVMFDKGTSDYFKGWRSVNIGKEAQTFETVLLPYHFFEQEYNAAYVKNGKLNFFSSESGYSSVFPEELPVFNFAYSPNDSTLYYTILENDSLVLKRADFLENTVRMTGIALLHRHRDEFINPVSMQRGIMITNYDTVFLECGFSRTNMQFESVLACIPHKEYSVPTMDDLINERTIELLELQQNEDAKFMQNIMLIKMKAFSDLNRMMNQKPVEKVNYQMENDLKTSEDPLLDQKSQLILADSIEYISTWQ